MEVMDTMVLHLVEVWLNGLMQFAASDVGYGLLLSCLPYGIYLKAYNPTNISDSNLCSLLLPSIPELWRHATTTIKPNSS